MVLNEYNSTNRRIYITSYKTCLLFIFIRGKNRTKFKSIYRSNNNTVHKISCNKNKHVMASLKQLSKNGRKNLNDHNWDLKFYAAVVQSKYLNTT